MPDQPATPLTAQESAQAATAQPTTQQAAPVPAQPSTMPRPDGVGEAEWAALGDPGKAALVRERTAAAEAQHRLADALAKVQQYEDQGKSDAQRAADALAAAQQSAAEATAKAARLEAAAKVGLDLSLAPRLVGATPAELEADAQALAAMVAPPGPDSRPAPAPRPDLTQGGTGSPVPLNSDRLEQDIRAKLGI